MEASPKNTAGKTIAYVRISSVDQNEARQIAAIGSVDKIFIDKLSGSIHNRPQLEAMLDYIREDDLVLVKSPDRLARSTTDLLRLVQEIKNKGAQLCFIDNPSLNTDTAQGAFMLTVLGAVAELERATIRERQAEGIALAKERGVYSKQRSPKLDSAAIKKAKGLVAQGVPKTRIARGLGVSRTTLYQALSGTGRYAPSTAEGAIKEVSFEDPISNHIQIIS